VVSNREAVRSWLIQEQKRRCSRHVLSEGPTIYSYGAHFPMATFHDRNGTRYALMTHRRYSQSTARHLSIVGSALRDIPVLYVDDPTATNHETNVACELGKYRAVVQTFRRARRLKAYWLAALEAICECLNTYCDLFDLKRPLLLPPQERERFEVELMTYRLLAA
jgi:hypothetical protein